MITYEIANKLVQYKLNSALVSVHGLGGIHEKMVGIEGAFLETWNGIAVLKNSGIMVTPNFVLTPKNLHGLHTFGEKAISQGLRQIAVTPFLPSWQSLF